MYNEQTGLGAIELAVLRSLDEMGARRDTPYRKSANVLQYIAEHEGIGPRHAYEVLCTLAAPWNMNVPLVDFHGNAGGLDPADKPANPRYTEVRMSRIGAHALAGARGDGPKLPILLVNGDLWNGGGAPPFAPEQVAEAVRLARRSDVGDDELVATVGAPEFASRCDLDGDVAALARGEPTELRCSSRVEQDGPDLVISRFPPGIGSERIGRAIADRLAGERAIRRADMPLRDVRVDGMAWNEQRVVCSLRSDANTDSVRQLLLETWPVSVRKAARLPRALPVLLRQFADDAAAQNPVLDALTR
jgi:DNA gyrase/topoisomerase IV subunit A